jgi:hypothetical protein
VAQVVASALKTVSTVRTVECQAAELVLVAAVYLRPSADLPPLSTAATVPRCIAWAVAVAAVATAVAAEVSGPWVAAVVQAT